MTQDQEIQGLFRVYKQATKQEFVVTEEYAKWLVHKGWELPTPQDPITLLAKKIQDALRKETRRDAITGREYKVNLSFSSENGQGSFLIDVDEAKRHVVVKCLQQRREQTAGDAYQIELIQEHWNNLHPNEEPINLPHDYTMDVMIKKANDGDASQEEVA